MGRLAILAGGGNLPVLLAQADPDALRVVFAGVSHDLPDPVREHRFERLGALFSDLHDQGVSRVVFAGAMARPAMDPAAFDPETALLAPRLSEAMAQGDDAVLRLVAGLFEDEGFAVIGAHEILPDLAVPEGLVAGPEPEPRQLADADRAADILLALSPLDIGQGAVVAGGLCLGIETLQGTDALLRFVRDTPPHLRLGRGGVLVKMPKRGQDMRADMPAIGPHTVRNAANAGLDGIVVAAGQVLMLDRQATLDALTETGLFLLGRAP